MSEHPPAADAPDPAPEAPRRDPAGEAWDRIVRGIERPVERALAEYRVPLAVLLLVLAASLWFAQKLADLERVRMAELAAAKSAQVASQISLGLDERARAIGDLADRWSRLPVDDDAWSRDAALVIQRDIQFRAIAWLSPALEILRMRPTTADVPLSALDRADAELRRTALTTMGSVRVAFSHSYLLGDGKRQVLVRALVDRPDGSTDVMIGVARPGDLFDALAGDEIKNGWSIGIYEGPYQLYGPAWAAGGDEVQWTREGVATSGTWTLTVRVWPSAELAERMSGAEARTTAIAGAVIALLFAIAVRRIQVLSRRAAA